MSKGVWIFLLGLTGVLALWRGSMGGWDLWQYSRLNMDVPIKEISYEVVPKRSKYALVGNYSYVYKGKELNGRSLLPGPKHLNRASAQLDIQRMKGMDRVVWINAQKPSVSSLEDDFPFREVFYGICTIGIFLYFLYLFFFHRVSEIE